MAKKLKDYFDATLHYVLVNDLYEALGGPAPSVGPKIDWVNQRIAELTEIAEGEGL